jgi:hypothetical protein
MWSENLHHLHSSSSRGFRDALCVDTGVVHLSIWCHRVRFIIAVFADLHYQTLEGNKERVYTRDALKDAKTTYNVCMDMCVVHTEGEGGICRYGKYVIFLK